MNDRIAGAFGHPKSVRMLLLGLLSIAGLSFWFFLGFPFANHNESYLLVVQLNRYGFLDVLSNRLRPVSNLRPLGMATAWLGYRLSGGSIYPQQVFNYVGAALAWLILFLAIREKRLFAAVSFVVGGAFFSGYIYLFHLHGVFYSPLLMFLAFLLADGASRRGIRIGWLLTVSVCAAIAALFHPFALLIYAAFALGYFFENLHLATREQLAVSVLCVGLSLGLMKVLVPSRNVPLTVDTLLGLYTSYTSVEVNIGLSLVSWLLNLVTVMGWNTPWRTRALAAGIVTALSLAFVLLKWPVVIIWIATCLFKSALLKKWSIVLLIVTTAMLPAVTATGSPTYAVFVLMVCSYVASLGYAWLEKDSVVGDGITILSLILVLGMAVLLKSGAQVPVASRLVTPLFAEKEKTYQMEAVIRWMMTSDFKESRLVLCQTATSANAVDRTNRPPTSQGYLDAYVDSLRTHPLGENPEQIFVCFGGERPSNADPLYAVAGGYNGDAIVWNQGR